ncbi:MAG: hypothetical protein RL596_2550, partial [Bacteroidota bacterium]
FQHSFLCRLSLSTIESIPRMMMALTSTDILNALKTVNDPELHKSLTELGMVDNIVIEGTHVCLDIILTTKACPLKDKIKNDAREAVLALTEATEATINISGKTLTPRLPQKQGIPGVKNIIAVSSGKGGVGKSTVAVNIACAMAKLGATVGILDADIYGPNVPIMMGLQNASIREMNENGKAILPQNHGVKVMSISFLVKPDQALIWRGPILHKSISQFFTDFDWGELDYLVIDMPPGTGDIHLTLMQTVPVTGVVIVTTPQKVALADAKKGIAMFGQAQINVPIIGLVENMAFFTPAELPENKYYLFGKEGGKNLAEEYDLPFLGQVPLVQSIREGGDEGKPAMIAAENTTKQAFRDFTAKAVRNIALRNANMPHTKLIEVVA